jgi:DNA-binding NtrC family response regulator
MGEKTHSSHVDPSSPKKAGLLSGSCILIVEDEVIIAMDVAMTLEDAGAHIVGPAHTISQAMSCIENERISLGLLDLRLGHEEITPVAQSLTARGIPFAFYSGQTPSDPLCVKWPGILLLQKPTSGARLVEALAGLADKARHHC